MPDFFLDHFVRVESLETLLKDIGRTAEQGGGNILGNSQLVRRGGNAANTASALHTLQVPAMPIITTDDYGLRLLESLTDPSMDLTHVHTDGALSATVSLEGEYGGRRANVMISDSGSAKEFRFNDLTETDLDAIRDSQVVVLVNLNHNSAAVQLTQQLFQFVKDQTRAVTYLDIGDPSARPDMVDKLVDEVLTSGLVDVLGINENEAAWLYRALHGPSSDWDKIVSDPKRWLSTSQLIHEETGCPIDLHTPYFSSSIRKSATVSVPAFDVAEETLCGAGDAWNAGNVYGILRGFSDEERLYIANAAAALYVSSSEAEHPSLERLLHYLESNPGMSIHGTKLLKSQ